MKMRVIKINEGTLEMKAKLEKYSHHIKYMQHNEETQFVLHKIHPIEFRNYVPCTIKGSLKAIDGATLLTYRVFPTLFTTINIGIMVAIVIAFFLFAAKPDITFFSESPNNWFRVYCSLYSLRVLENRYSRTEISSIYNE